MKDAIMIIIMKNCNAFQVHRCIECTGELEAAKDQGSSRLQTSINEAAFSVKGTVYNSWYKSFTLGIKCNMCKAVIR